LILFEISSEFVNDLIDTDFPITSKNNTDFHTIKKGYYWFKKDTADFSGKYKLFTHIIAMLNIEHSYYTRVYIFLKEYYK
jgi:hypothetical protein